MHLRRLICLALLGALTACGSTRTPPAEPALSGSVFAPFSSTPPAAVGSGLVCGAAADRVLGIVDHLDLGRLERGSAAPQSSLIRQAVEQYATASKDGRDRAAGLIVGQCAAYGFYIITYRECLRPTLVGNVASAASVKSCIDRRRWTLYTQQ